VPPSITWAFTDQVTKYPYDPERAKKLLAEAGYPNGFPAVVLDSRVRLRHAVAQDDGAVDPGDLAAVGITASIQTFEWGAYLNKYGKGFGQDADMGAMSFMLDPGDPAPMLSLVIDGKGGFRGGAYATRRSTRCCRGDDDHDLKKRGELYRQVQKLVVDDAPWIFVDNALQNAAGAKKVAGFKLHPSFYLFFDKISVTP
jgi:peptide/nickel transport system substrate-binding protein